MTTIKGRSPTWGNLGKGSDRIQAQIPEEPEKGMSEWGGSPAQVHKELGRKVVSLKESLPFPKPKEI